MADGRDAPVADRTRAWRHLERDEQYARQLLAHVAGLPGLGGNRDGIDLADGGRFDGDQRGGHRHRLELDAQRGEVGAACAADDGAQLLLDDLPRPALGAHAPDGDGRTQSVRERPQLDADHARACARGRRALSPPSGGYSAGSGRRDRIDGGAVPSSTTVPSTSTVPAFPNSTRPCVFSPPVPSISTARWLSRPSLNVDHRVARPARWPATRSTSCRPARRCPSASAFGLSGSDSRLRATTVRSAANTNTPAMSKASKPSGIVALDDVADDDVVLGRLPAASGPRAPPSDRARSG